jgi:hypothetical protein
MIEEHLSFTGPYIKKLDLVHLTVDQKIMHISHAEVAEFVAQSGVSRTDDQNGW